MYTMSAKKINLIKTGVSSKKYPDGSFKNRENNIICFLLYIFHKTAKVTP